MTNSEQTAAPQPESPQPENTQNTNLLLGEAGEIEQDSDNIYLDLDAILDTRLGTLAGMGENYAVNALKSGQYHRRLLDEYEGVPVQTYRETYAQRNNDTLKRSVLTNVSFFLRRLIKDSLISAIINQKVERLCFTVNVYPYDFSDPGLVEMLIACIRFHTYSTSSVRIVSIANEELSPEFCVKNFQIMIRYDYLEWMDKHKPFFEQRGIPSMTVVGPEIFRDSIPTQDDIDRLELKKRNPFRMMEAQVAPLFRLKLMPVSLFSINEGITQENAANLAALAQVSETDIEDYLNKRYPKATIVQDNPLPAVDLSDAFELL